MPDTLLACGIITCAKDELQTVENIKPSYYSRSFAPSFAGEVVFLLLVACFDLFLTKLSPLLQRKKEDRYKTTGSRAVCCLERVRIQHVSLKIESYVETMPTS